MSSDRWQHAEKLYHEALKQEPGKRSLFLVQACNGDEDLLREVESMLTFLETSVQPETVGQPAGVRPASLAAGTRLGVYRIDSTLGAGGMGVVYRANDTKLGRDVAIKVLPERFASDSQGLMRFEREARMLAALNHPNIASIYGLEEAEALHYLVMEMVPGRTLAQKLAAGEVTLQEGLRYCAQIAEALEYAHEKSIIHRDLKPANVIITPEGRLKLLDFGLAKSFQSTSAAQGSELETITEEMTRAGTVLGTAAYMSPEQARGKPLDKRTDIWSFGCVLYEVLARRRAFRGETSTEFLTAILSHDPDWDALPASTPESVRVILERCLEKDSLRRLRDIGEARIELENVLTGSVTPRTGTSRRAIAAAPGHPKTTIAVVAGSAAGILIALGTGLFFYFNRETPPVRAPRFSIDLPAGESIPPTHSSQVAFSPDGTLIAYGGMKMMAQASAMAMPMPAAMPASPAGGMAAPGGMSQGTQMASMPSMPAASGSTQVRSMPSMPSKPSMSAMMGSQIYVRPIDQQDARPIEGAVGDAPFFSPDGKWLGFWHAPTRTLRKVALSGGAPVKICGAESGVSGAAWGQDDTIVFAWFDLFRVPAAGGDPKLLLKVDEKNGERFYRHPSFLPGGKAILFTISTEDTESYDNGRIAVLSLETGEKKIVLEGGFSARYSPSGHLVYAREGKLMAVPFDLRKLQVTGPPVPVLDGVFMSTNTGMAAFSISSNGGLVYAAGGVEGGVRSPVWVDRKGGATPLPLPARSYLHPRLSPDERQLAIEVEGPAHDFFTYDFSRGALTKLSFDGASHWPMWTPKGDRLTFRSWKTGTMTMWWMPVDRSSPPELLTNIGSMQSPESWSPDGKTLAFTQMDEPQNAVDVYVLSLDGDRKPRALLKSRFAEGSPKFSPDGKWLAYSSDESGQPEIYAMAFPGPGPTIQISTSGGTDPVWRPKGGEIYYRNGDQMLAVTITNAKQLTVSKPTLLWSGHYMAGVGSSCGMSGPTSANYDVTADGQRFLMIEDKAQDVVGRQLNVIPGWSEDLKRAKRN
jgi:serine/threonine protein kinase/Tol biopolymer transport system component